MSTAVVIPGAEHRDLAKQAHLAARDWAERLLATSITTPEQLQWAVDTAKAVREQQKMLEAERDKICKPLNKISRDHSAAWKPAIDLLGKIVAHLRQAAIDFQVAERQRQAAAISAATSQAEIARATAAIETRAVGLQERDHWRARVVDESKLPREYWIIDQARLDREAAKHKQNFNVPGCEVVREKRGALT